MPSLRLHCDPAAHIHKDSLDVVQFDLYFVDRVEMVNCIETVDSSSEPVNRPGKLCGGLFSYYSLEDSESLFYGLVNISPELQFYIG